MGNSCGVSEEGAASHEVTLEPRRPTTKSMKTDPHSRHRSHYKCTRSKEGIPDSLMWYDVVWQAGGSPGM